MQAIVMPAAIPQERKPASSAPRHRQGKSWSGSGHSRLRLGGLLPVAQGKAIA